MKLICMRFAHRHIVIATTNSFCVHGTTMRLVATITVHSRQHHTHHDAHPHLSRFNNNDHAGYTPTDVIVRL